MVLVVVLVAVVVVICIVIVIVMVIVIVIAIVLFVVIAVVTVIVIVIESLTPLIVSPSGHPPTLSDRRSSDSYLSFVLLPPCEALVVGLELRSESAQILKTCGAPRARWEVILGAPNASWELRLASQRLLASDVEALEMSL